MEARPKTILFLHPSDELYGADRVILYLVQRLDPAAWRPLFILPTDLPYQGQLSALLKEAGVPTLHMDLCILRRKYMTPAGLLLMGWRLSKSMLQLRRLIRDENVAIVHSTTTSVFSGAFAARLTGTPHIWHVHEILTNPRLLWRALSFLIPRMSDRVVTVSGPTRAHLCEGNSRNEGKAIVLHNGIDPAPFHVAAGRDRLRSEWGIPAGAVVVGMIGRISAWKGQDHFLKAAKAVAAANPAARFVIVGGTIPGQESMLDRIKALAAESGLADKTTFSDFRQDVPDVLAAFDIFVLPSTLPDPLPTVVLEAMAAGKPVVANAHGGSTEMVADGLTGYLVPPDKPEAMAEKILYLAAHPDKGRAMGMAGRARQLSEFSMEAYIRKWSQVYAGLVAAR